LLISRYTEFFDKLGFDTKAVDEAKDKRWKQFDGKTLEAHQKGNPVGVKALNHLRAVLSKQGYDPSKLRPMMLAFRGTLALESVDDSVSRDEFKKAVCAVRELRLADEEVRKSCIRRLMRVHFCLCGKSFFGLLRRIFSLGGW
jgi:hypothetical protein